MRPLGFGHFADVAHQMGHQRAVRVVALRLGLNQEARKDQPPLLELRYDRERRVGKNGHRQVGRAPVAGQDALDADAVESHERREAPQGRVQRVFVRRREQRDSITRHVLGEHLAVAVGDNAARRRQRDRTQPVGLGLELVLGMLEDLRAEKHDDQRHPRPPHDQADQPQPALEQVRMERAHASLSRTAMRRPTSQSTSTPAAAVVRL